MHEYGLPNVNSLDGNPEAERAAIAADGPGIGVTGIFSAAHSLACEQLDSKLSINDVKEKHKTYTARI